MFTSTATHDRVKNPFLQCQKYGDGHHWRISVSRGVGPNDTQEPNHEASSLRLPISKFCSLVFALLREGHLIQADVPTLRYEHSGKCTSL
eukprot:1157783-Amphidinium_carterae.1